MVSLGAASSYCFEPHVGDDHKTSWRVMYRVSKPLRDGTTLQILGSPRRAALPIEP